MEPILTSDIGSHDDSNPNKKPNAKHVSRACLQCRHRHLKCDGQMPKCSRCVQHDKDCSYVKSNRGGSRKKGVKKAKIVKSTDLESLKLPCVGSNGEVKPCPNGHDASSCGFLADKKVGALPCLPNKSSTAKTQVDLENFRKINKNTNKILDQNFNNLKSIISNYYRTFHNSHPILPPLNDIDEFLSSSENPKEIILLMKVIGDGYVTSKYSKNINEIFQIASEILELINSKTKDVITLQCLILLSLACHISALHDLSTTIRKQAIELAISLDINNLDSNDFKGEDINGNVIDNDSEFEDEVNINFCNTKRIRNLPDLMLKESARRCFWELFFLDIIIGSADGKTLSKLTSIKCFVKFPSIPSRFQFDYETRSYTSKLVDDSVRLNNIIFSEMSIGHQYTKLTASLSNWELKLSDPDFYKLPYLIDGNGIVNEGIQQGLIMLNYAKIFTHRPLSFLWRSDIPRNLKCVEKLNDELNKSENNFQEIPNEKDLINSRKIIETRKTIDAANLIAKTLIDTNPIDILKRTPLNACSLAFAGLVHLSAYLWSSQVVQSTDNQNNLNLNDLHIYEEYMKLELSGIYQISAHWYLSSKIANYLLDSISKLLPDLFKKMQVHFQHHIESNKKIENNVKVDSRLTKKELKKEQESISKSSSNELAKVIYGPTGYVQTGMTYNLPNLTTSSSVSETSNSPSLSKGSPRFQEVQPLFSTTPESTTSSSNNSNLISSLENIPTQQLNIAPLFPTQTNSPASMTGDFILPFELNPISPNSDTGCDWIDNNQLDFDFKNYNFGEFDIDSLTAIDDMIKSASTLANAT